MVSKEVKLSMQVYPDGHAFFILKEDKSETILLRGDVGKMGLVKWTDSGQNVVLPRSMWIWMQNTYKELWSNKDVL